MKYNAKTYKMAIKPTAESAKEQPSAAIETIGPEQAKAILVNNTYNRKISPRRVTRYAMMMTREKWVFTGESVILNGAEVLDGAHRLRAIEQSGVTLQLVIVRGVEREAFKYIDSGASRNLGDSLYIQQRPYPRLFANAVNYLTGFRLYARWTTSGVEVPDRWATIEQYPQIEDIIPLYSGHMPASLSGISRGILIAAHALFQEKDPDAAAEFSELLLSEFEDLEAGNPVRAYHAWWLGVLKKLEVRDVVRDVFAKTGNGLIRTWNSFRKGETVDKLRPPTSAPDID